MAKGRGSVNKVILIGNCGADPETRALPSGAAVTNVRIATTEGWRDKDSGENRERTEWHSLTMYGRLAEIASQYLRKGSKIFVEGSLRTRSWEKDEVKHYRTEVIVDEMTMLDSRGGSQGASQGGASAAGASRAEPQPQSPQQPAAEPLDDSFEDDIPF